MSICSNGHCFKVFCHSLQRTMSVRAVERFTNQGKDVTITTPLYTVARRNLLVMTVENYLEDQMPSKFTCSLILVNSHSRYRMYIYKYTRSSQYKLHLTKNICFSATPVMLVLRRRETLKITLRRHIHPFLTMEENPSKAFKTWRPIYSQIILHLKLKVVHLRELTMFNSASIFS